MVKITLNREVAPIQGQVDLDAAQLRVANVSSGAMRVLAGPGCGKTTTLVAAMARRLSPTNPNALASDQVLGLTFARKSATDWRNQVSAQIAGAAPLVTTFHSFAYSLLRAQAATKGEEFRLLAGAEQQVLIRELLAGGFSDGSLELGPELHAAANTKGLAEQVRALISRARAFGLDSTQLVAMSKTANHPLWATFAPFMDDYLDNLDAQGLLDYSELILRATISLNSNSDLQRQIHTQYRAIFVDEYQDVDPGQIALLKALVGPDCSLIVVGDVDQAIYGFRGADEAALGRFVEDFQSLFSAPIETVVLDKTRRFGAAIRNAATSVLGTAPVRGFTTQEMQQHRHPSCDLEFSNQIDFATFDSPGSQGAHIADAIARAHTADGLSWDEIAVIVRGSASVAPLVRALTMAGIPTEVAADEMSLALDPALYPLLLPLRITADPKLLNAESAQDLLTGPLGGLDQVALRALVRASRTLAQSDSTTVPSTEDVLLNALRKPLAPQIHAQLPEVAAQVDALRELLTKLQAAAVANKTPHEMLWLLWNGSDWSKRLEERALAGSLSAHRDLDAIVALFALAARFVSRGRAKDLANFLADVDAQEIPLEPIAQANTRGQVVRILTAHRAKGLQWPFVIIADMQEQIWPDLKLRGSILKPELVGKAEALLPESFQERLASERRLAYVAITRASSRLLITSVNSSASDGEALPSRFMIAAAKSQNVELAQRHIVGRPKRALNADAFIAYLRSILQNPNSSEALKAAVAEQVAKLAAQTNSAGAPLLAQADPNSWWATRERTQNQVAPLTEIPLSASTLEKIEACPAKWFLEHEASAVKPSTQSAIFGNVLHRLAEGIAKNEVAANAQALHEYIERIWPSLPVDMAWHSDNELLAAKAAATKMVNWLGEITAQMYSEVEVKYQLAAKLPDRDGALHEVNLNVSGFIDLLCISDEGAQVYDFKTSKQKPTEKEVLASAQLALYLHLVEVGDLVDIDIATVAQSAGLVELRFPASTKAAHLPKVLELTAAQSSGDIEERLVAAAEVIYNEAYEARAGKHCEYCALKSMCPLKVEGKQVAQ